MKTILQDTPKLLLSKRDAAFALDISLRTLDGLIARKVLPTRKIGRRTLIALSDLQQFAHSDHETRPG